VQPARLTTSLTKGYSWSTACISCSNSSNISSRYSCITTKSKCSRTSDRRWRYIHSSCNSLRAYSSVTAWIGSTISSCSCLGTAGSIYNITLQKLQSEYHRHQLAVTVVTSAAGTVALQPRASVAGQVIEGGVTSTVLVIV
jgi:hypothetical protein